MNRIRELRQARGWSQRELAERAHIAQALLSDLELEIRLPWQRAALALSQVFGVPIEGIFPAGVPVRDWKRKHQEQPSACDEYVA